jgi:hypothetical protein
MAESGSSRRAMVTKIRGPFTEFVGSGYLDVDELEFHPRSWRRAREHPRLDRNRGIGDHEKLANLTNCGQLMGPMLAVSRRERFASCRTRTIR